MWKKTYGQFYPNLSLDAVWQIWTDINNWPKWHGDLDYCKLEGACKVGHHFMLKPKGAPAVKVTLTDIVEKQHFTDTTRFLGATMINTHSMKAQGGGVLLTSTLEMKGPLKWLWIKLVAKNVAHAFPKEMDALAKLAKSTVSAP